MWSPTDDIPVGEHDDGFMGGYQHVRDRMCCARSTARAVFVLGGVAAALALISPSASIGGAGTFDGVFLSGIIAVLLVAAG